MYFYFSDIRVFGCSGFRCSALSEEGVEHAEGVAAEAVRVELLQAGSWRQHRGGGLVFSAALSCFFCLKLIV